LRFNLKANKKMEAAVGIGGDGAGRQPAGTGRSAAATPKRAARRGAILLASVAFVFGAAQASLAQQSEPYPTRPIRIVAPFSPGGPLDAFGRPLADKLSQALGQAFIFENRPGANGAIGTNSVAQAAPDGYTMLMMTSAFTGNAASNPNLPYNAFTDLAPITQLVRSHGFVLMLRKTHEAKTLPVLVKLAKASPGKFAYGHAGVGNINQVAGELFQKVAGIELLSVPYKGATAYIADIISDQLDMGFTSTVTATPNVQAGLLQGIAIAGPRRIPVLPNMPTFIEHGYPEMNLTGYYGLWFPAGTPRERIDLIHREVVKAIATPELKRVLEQTGVDAVGSSPEEFAAFLQTEYEVQVAINKRIGGK
jgi:tripartite-type tricarboxylate transporter receptor subunit TctC